MMKLFALSLFLCFLRTSESESYNNITRIDYDGVLVMFRVPKERVAEKLAEYNSNFSCSGSKCFDLLLPFKCIVHKLL